MEERRAGETRNTRDRGREMGRRDGEKRRRGETRKRETTRRDDGERRR